MPIAFGESPDTARHFGRALKSDFKEYFGFEMYLFIYLLTYTPTLEQKWERTGLGVDTEPGGLPSSWLLLQHQLFQAPGDPAHASSHDVYP